MNNLLAQNLNISGQTINGPVTKFNNITDIINASLKLVFPIALFILFVVLLWSGFDMVRNLGNAKLVESAKARITNALVGIILLAISYWAAQIIFTIFFDKPLP